MESVAAGTVRGKRVLDPSPDLPLAVTSVCISDDRGIASAIVPRSSPVVIIIHGEVREVLADCDEYLIAIDVKTVDDMLLFRTHNIEQQESGRISHIIGSFILKCVLPPDLLPSGTYRLGIHTAIAGKKYLEDTYPVLEFDVIQDKLLGNIFVGTHGILTPRCDWEFLHDAD